ncbi:hypothetical protein ACJW30_01G210500 [Castanea mollissima]
MANEEKLHIAIFPWLAYGQVMPYFELSKFLAQKGHKNFLYLTLMACLELLSPPPSYQITKSHTSKKKPMTCSKLEPHLIQILQNSDVNWIIHDFFSLALNASVLAFFGPPSEMTNVYRKSLEDFTVSPKWIDFPCDVAYNVPELLSHRVCMDMNMSDLTRAATFEADALSLLEKLYQKPVVPIGLLPPSVQR